MLPVGCPRVVIGSHRALPLLFVPPTVRVHRVEALLLGQEPLAPLSGDPQDALVRGDVEGVGRGQELHAPYGGLPAGGERLESLDQTGLAALRVVAQLFYAPIPRRNEDDVQGMVVLVLGGD